MNSIVQRNNVKIFGNGTQVMMFAHGFGCDQNMWRYITPEFEKDYKIILFDYVGSGQSELSAYNKDRYSNLNGYAQDIIEICIALDLKNIIFVGHSVSCMIGLLAAIKNPHYFSNMIFVGPSARYLNEAPAYIGGFEKEDIDQLLETMDKNYIGWANFLGPAIMKNADKPELSAELTASFCSTDPIIARQFAEVTFLSDNRQDLHKLKIPTLIMQCSDDFVAPEEVGKYITAQIHNSSLRIMKATGHCPHMSAPAETVEIMKDYLNTNLSYS